MSNNKSASAKDNLQNLRVFGFIWALIFLIIAFKTNWNILAIIFAVFFSVISLLKPDFFERSKIMPIWLKLGEVIGKINSKIIIFVMFYFLFTPIGLILKIMGKDLLKKKLQPNSKSYFIPRTQTQSDMRNQF